MAAVLYQCEKCKSTKLKEIDLLKERVGFGGYEDVVRLKCEECQHEQEGRVLRRERVPPWVMI